MAEVQAHVPSQMEGFEPMSSRPNAPNPRLRKRTKTGCLTCRKRRIKCGEEKPVCGNCIKSKRHCEGYNQRVIFKPPIDNWPSNTGIHTLQYHTGGMPGSALREYRPEPSQVQGHSQQSPIATPLQSAPAGYGGYGFTQDLSMNHAQSNPAPPTVQPFSASFAPVSSSHQQPFHGIFINAPGPPPSGLTTVFPFPAQYQAPPSTQSSDQQHVAKFGQNNNFTPPQLSSSWTAPPQTPGMDGIQGYQNQFVIQPQDSHPGPSTTVDIKPEFASAPNPPYLSQPSFTASQPSQVRDQTSSYPSTHPQSSAQPSLPTASGHGLEHDSFNAIHAWQSSQQTRLIPPSHSDDISPPINDGSFQNLPPAPQTTGDSGPSVDGSIQTSATTPMTSESQKSYNIPFSSGATDVHPASAVWFPRTTAQDILEAGAVESHDDDFFDVEPEDDQAFALELASNQNHDFNSLIALHKQSISDFSTRGYDAFLTPDLLDIYHPEYAANPLKNEATRRIFAHFIHATGPSLSIYERNPGNASGLFSEVHIPRSQQNLWTYTLPVLAINDQALLQVMLALGSLHIAKLQGASEMPSLKHYGYAIKRINKRLSDESKRHQATTLAASLLLGFYEVMAGEHMRWSTHIQGAQKLIVEIDYVGMTKQLRKSREAEASQKQNHKGMSDWHISLSHDAQLSMSTQLMPDLMANSSFHSQPRKDAPNEVDEGVLSTLVGREVRFDDFGQVEPEGSSSQGRTNPKKGFHLDHYDIYQDLFWWYCRQDAYQSIISGEPLLMSYDKWTDCPPRAKLGKAAVYGTHDHLILLLGRISDFAARDRPRKTRQLQAFGPQWKTPGPPPGMGRGGPPSGMAGRPGQNQPSVDPNAFPAGRDASLGAGAGPQVSQPDRGGVPRTQPTGPPLPSNPHASPNFTRHPQGQPGGPPPGTGPLGLGGAPNGPPPGARPPGLGGPPNGPPPGMAPPPFFGMAPVTRGHMPSAYKNNDARKQARFIPRPPRAGPSSPSSRSDASHSSSTSSKKARDIADLPAATAAALEEWNSILKALTVFEMELGPNFQPLSPEFAPTVHTPFGPAMQYRSFDRAVVWGLYHMCHLILQRSHPTMPPAAMMAAAVSGHQTAQRAQEIGRVAAGIIDSAGGMGSTNLSGAPHAPLNPSLGAAIYEITVPLFFAGIQFMDPSQREWLVDRVLMIHRRTGFQSAGAIAMGCESAWENAALRGGPPYTRRDTRGFNVVPRASLVPHKKSREAPQQSSSSAGGQSHIPHFGRAIGNEIPMGSQSGAPNAPSNPTQPLEDEIDPLEKLKLDRKSALSNPTARIHYAMGVLSMEDDYQADEDENDNEEVNHTNGQHPGQLGVQEPEWSMGSGTGILHGYQGFPDQR